MKNPEFKKTILIGLGGAGQQTVLRTKRLFMDRYGALPPSVKILCLDTDAATLKLSSEVNDQDYTFEPQEFLHLKVEQPIDFIKNSSKVQSWFSAQNTPIGSISNGAGAVRQNGRLAFFYHFNEIEARFTDILEELNRQELYNKMHQAEFESGANTNFELSKKAPEIYVCGSLAGGTGSGTFIDTGLLLRHLHPQTLIHGFFMMSWPYRNKAFAHRVGPNVYAALTELDNLQSIMYGAKGFHDYSIRYTDKTKIKVKNAPYDLVHLIDGRNEYGENLGGIEAICNSLSDAIFLSMSPMTDRVDSAVDNLLSAINVGKPKTWGGRYARYSSIGISSIHYPAKELHKLIAATNALELCRTAISQLESGNEVAVVDHNVQQDVDKFVTQTNLHREYTKTKISPDKSKVILTIENYEIADKSFPSEIDAQIESEQKTFSKQIEQRFQTSGAIFIDEVASTLETELKRIANKPEFNSAYQREWGSRLLDHFTSQQQQVDQEIVNITQSIDNLNKDVESRRRIALDASYIPFIGGGRKKATCRWTEQAEELLTAHKKQLNLNNEKIFYTKMVNRLEQAASIDVPNAPEILQALIVTENNLRLTTDREQKQLEILKNKPNHVLLGNGNTVLVDEALTCTTWDDLHISYEKYIQDQEIHHIEKYFETYQESPDALYNLFHQYCLKQLQYLAETDVDTALQSLKLTSDNPEQYIQTQFNRLIQLSGALWCFDQGRINTDQQLDVGKIINFGFANYEAGEALYQPIIDAAVNHFHIKWDPSYSTAGDPSRIWLLNFAAAMPAYFMNGLSEAKKTYEEEIRPTYHIDTDLEMNAPDLFPAGEVDNKALRLLGMAIVPGIDIIKDEKIAKGHKFTLNQKAINELFYFGEPKVWFLFRDMLDEIKSNYDYRNENNLLDLLTKLLKEKIRSMDKVELRKNINHYTQQVHEKIDPRHFSRLISARLTYQEINALERFLKSEAEGGYAMDINKYLAG
ncbi:MAG: hypothetical protein methR_P0632 [Methyloprofundus sp.]|nr:MAG: hypothetical protein methR_P0632 [Methyloprofundus sp.]